MVHHWRGARYGRRHRAGRAYAGFFEELSPEQFEAQLTTNLLGPLNVTRAVLPVMRKQRSGHEHTASSAADRSTLRVSIIGTERRPEVDLAMGLKDLLQFVERRSWCFAGR